MSRSLRNAAFAASAAVLMSAATASGALAANPITVSLSGTQLVIDDPTGVGQAELVATAGSGFEITEVNSANELVAGAGITAAVQYSNRHWVVIPTNTSVTISRVVVYGRGGNDGVNTSGVTNVPVTLQGNTGSDLLIAGPGSDVVNGGDGTDSVEGGAGNDLLTGGTGADDVEGNNGDDQIFEYDGAADTVDGGNDYDEFTRDAFDTGTNIELYQ